MNTVISWILAIFAVIGGLDFLFGSKLGLGSKFEKALSLMGPMATSITGVIIMVPVLSLALQKTVVPLFAALGFDPGVFGGLIPAVSSLRKTWLQIRVSASSAASTWPEPSGQRSASRSRWGCVF